MGLNNTFDDRRAVAVAWYQGLSRVEQLAVNAWLFRDDLRLINWLKPQSPRLQRYEQESGWLLRLAAQQPLNQVSQK
jgi:hypothetical protein